MNSAHVEPNRIVIYFIFENRVWRESEIVYIHLNILSGGIFSHVSKPHSLPLSPSLASYSQRKPSDVIPTSPYPTLTSSRVADVTDRYNVSHIEAVIMTLEKNRHCLESNFETMLRAKNDADVYNIVDSIINDR